MAKKDSEIFNLAQQSGLCPRHEYPHGPNPPPPHIWTTRCPGTGHYLYINLEKELYYCGWCKRGGGPSSLLDFVKDREEKAKAWREELRQEGFGSPPIAVPSRALRPSKPTATEDPVQPNPSRDERKGEAS